MAKWDLFVDESGTFDTDKNNTTKTSKHNLVGGFLVRQGTIDMGIAKNLMGQARSEANNQKGRPLINNINRFNRAPYTGMAYDFSHAEENKLYPSGEHPYPSDTEMDSVREQIRDIQLIVTKVYHDSITDKDGYDGYIVIFDDPAKVDFGGNYANYMSMIGMGVVSLYKQMINLGIDEAPEIYLNIAHRDNQEKDTSKKVVATDVDTLRTTGHLSSPKDITENEYRQTIKNAARFVAGELNENKKFNKIMQKDHCKIISNYEIDTDGSFKCERDDTGKKIKVIDRDGQPKDKRIQNALVCICDFICNSFYRGADDEQWNGTDLFKQIYKSDRTIYIPVSLYSDQTKPSAERFLELLRKTNTSQKYFDEFFNNLNRIQVELQRTFVQGIVDHYYMPVRNCVGSGEAKKYESELRRILKKTGNEKVETDGPIKNSEIRTTLRANILLMLYHVYIHMGEIKTASEIENQFMQQIDLMEQIGISTTTNELLARFYNRQIVSLTDSFKFNDAEDAFFFLKEYWSSKLSQETDLYLSKRGNKQINVTSEEYGEEIGSYLQVLTHELSALPESERKEHYKKVGAEELCAEYLRQFTTDAQRDRCYQYICDLKAKIGDFDDAFDNLYKDACIFDDPKPEITDKAAINRDNCSYVAKIAIKNMHRRNSAWLLYHYLRLAVELIYQKKDESAKLMYDSLDKDYFNVQEYSIVGDTYLRATVFHKLANLVLKYHSSEAEISTINSLYGGAVSLLKARRGAIFKVIALAYCMEWISTLLQLEKWNDANSEISTFKSIYGDVCPRFIDEGMLNPYAVKDAEAAIEGYKPDKDVVEVMKETEENIKQYKATRDPEEKERMKKMLSENARILRELAYRVSY